MYIFFVHSSEENWLKPRDSVTSATTRGGSFRQDNGITSGIRRKGLPS